MSYTNQYMDLPDDPEEAFAVLNGRRMDFLQHKWDSNEGDSWNSERQYVDCMVAFDEVHNLNLLTTFRNPPRKDNEFADFFQDFRRHAEISSQKILMEAARRVKTGSEQIVALDANARTAIHALIEAIRRKLDELTGLSENKRGSLFNKLNAFAAELDRNRTRTEAFYAFAVETARAGRQVNDEIKPLQETIDRVFEWLDKAKKWSEALPPWSERKQIEGPQKRLPKPEQGYEDVPDDEIPF